MLMAVAIDYLPVIIFLAMLCGLASVMLLASWFVAWQKPYGAKNAPYECGFDPFERTKGRFDIRYALVAVLFVIFDLEVAFLFPWAVTIGVNGMVGFFAMMIFLLILTVGFIYEWQSGALEWE